MLKLPTVGFNGRHSMPGKHDCRSGAVVVGPYRYLLWREWNAKLPRLLWILLNPSTADERVDDPTLRRVLGFSQSYGFGGLEVVNLFALRSPHPRALTQVVDPVGPENDMYIREAVGRASKIVAAWGSFGTLYRRGDRIPSHIELSLLFPGITKKRRPPPPPF